MCGYGNRGTGDWKAEVVSVCFLSILGPKLNEGLLDINFEMFKYCDRQLLKSMIVMMTVESFALVLKT